MASPALEPLLGYVSRPRTDPVVEGLALIEDLADLRAVPEHTVVLLTRAASEAAKTYRFDVALRVARSRRVAALVLTARDVARITPTAAAVADRSGIALLGTGDEIDLSALAVAIARELAGDAEVALLRAHTALRAIDAHPAAGGDTDGLLRSAGAAVGVQIAMVAAEPDAGPRRPVLRDGQPDGWLTAPAQEGDMTAALDIVLHAAAANVAARGSTTAPTSSRRSPATRSSPICSMRRRRRARRSCTGPERSAWRSTAGTSPCSSTSRTSPIRRWARSSRRSRRACGWPTRHCRPCGRPAGHGTARIGGALVLVNSRRDDPGATASARVAKLMDEVLRRSAAGCRRR